MYTCAFKSGDKVKCIDDQGVDDYLHLGKTYTVHYLKSSDLLTLVEEPTWVYAVDRFELIEKEVYMEKQFNPKPGDKIICNNGKEYTCCTLKYLQEMVSKSITSAKPILGQRDFDFWNGWNLDGKYDLTGNNFEWDIREVIPAQKEETIPEEVEVEQLTYTPEDIRKAVINDLGWQDLSLDLIMKSLQKVTSKEYKEYLRLKAVFEQENE